MKPIFSYISENYPIYGTHRRAYVFLSMLIVSLMFLILSTLVSTTGGVFAVGFIKSFFHAFSELVLGLTLVDFALGDPSQVRSLQSKATAARIVGSIVAYLGALPLYGCADQDSQYDAKLVIGITAIFPILGAMLGLKLPEMIPSKPGMQDERIPAQGEEFEEELVEGGEKEYSLNFRTLVTSLGVFQLIIVWVGIEDLVPSGSKLYDAWTVCLVLLLILAVVFGALTVQGYNRVKCMDLRPAYAFAFLFLLNALPNAGSPWFSYQYYALGESSGCNIQGEEEAHCFALGICIYIHFQYITTSPPCFTYTPLTHPYSVKHTRRVRGSLCLWSVQPIGQEDVFGIPFKSIKVVALLWLGVCRYAYILTA